MDDLKPSPNVRLNSGQLLSENLQQILSMEWPNSKKENGQYAILYLVIFLTYTFPMSNSMSFSGSRRLGGIISIFSSLPQKWMAKLERPME
jgi:hypothetical protein